MTGASTKPDVPDRDYEVGEPVDVFYRFPLDKGPGYFPVDREIEGQLHPCIAKTDGWFPAIVEQKWNHKRYDVRSRETYVKIRFTNSLWFNRQGQAFTDHKYRRMEVTPELCRRARKQGEEAYYPPRVSIFVVRWGGKKKVDPVTEGIGGWGSVGSNRRIIFVESVNAVIELLLSNLLQ